jgi:hypothetical protein
LFAGRIQAFLGIGFWQKLANSARWLTGLELAAITFMGLVYIGLFMPLETNKSLNGVELERLAGVMLTAEVGLNDYGQIPTWNPYVGTGEPFLNNPFNYLFNPFSSLPILLFGGVAGSKIAVCLGLLIAGYTMWGLARVMGLGAVARVTTGVLYMASGGIAGKFQPGHFQLGLSLAWVPLALAGFWWTLHSHNRRAPILLAVAFALLFFAGNIYYTLHTIVCCGVMLAFHLIDIRPRLRIRADRLKRVAVGAIMALGLTAIQFVPVWSIRDSIRHGADPGLESRYGIEQIIDNFTMTWHDWQLFMPKNRLVSVDYAYIGGGTFAIIGLAAGALILIRRARRQFPYRGTLIALTCAGLMVMWGAGQSGLLQRLYANVPLLAQFRYVGRAQSVAALWLILLAGFAIDRLWLCAEHVFRTKSVFGVFDRARLIRAATAGVLFWMLYLLIDMRAASSGGGLISTLDSYRFGMSFRQHAVSSLTLFVVGALALDTLRLLIVFPLWNHEKTRAEGVAFRAIGTRVLWIGIIGVILAAVLNTLLVNSLVFKVGPREADLESLYTYVHRNDNTPIPAVLEPNTENYAFEAYTHTIRQWGLNEGWIPVALPNQGTSERFNDESRWTIVRDERAPAVQGKSFVLQQCLNEWTRQNQQEPCSNYGAMSAALYELPNTLPYAFIAPENALIYAPETLNGTNVLAPSRIEHEQDTITLAAQTPDDQRYYLVIQETHFPGWVGFIDGALTQTVSIGQFTSIPMLTGIHTYTIRYQPPGFTTGLAVSLIALVGIGFYLAGSRKND